MKDNKKSIKILLIALGVVLLIGIVVLIVFSGGRKDSEGTLLLECSKESQNKVSVTSRHLELRQVDEDLIYTDVTNIRKTVDNDEVEKMFDIYYKSTLQAVDEKIVTGKRTDNEMEITVSINLSKESEKNIVRYVGTLDFSVSNFKQHFEEVGLTCKEY